MTCPRSHSRLARWSGLQAPGQGFFCHTPILSRLWLTPYRPRESKCGLSFPPPQKRGAQCREAGIQEPLCAEARPRHVAPLPSRLLSLALVLMGRWEFPPPNLLLLSKPHTQGPDLLRNWQGRKQLEVWPKSKEQELSTLLASAPPSSSAKLPTRDGSSGGGRGAEERPSLQAQPQV